MKVDLQKLRELENDRWITLRPHSRLPLLIANYTQTTQFAGEWNECTKMCRGLILTTDGEVVARPFEKFFNVAQVEETKVENLPAEMPVITEKLDGSLGILYWDGDLPCMATRGSFDSDQAIWATNWIRRWWADTGKHKGILKRATYLFEIIYRSNRIVVSYGDREECVLLSVRTLDGSELNHDVEARRLGLPYARIINNSLEELQAYSKVAVNDEGFVLRYSNGLRAKMKNDEYVRLHRIVTSCSARRVWECLSAGMALEDWLERVPDELFAWADEKRKELNAQYFELFQRACEVKARVDGLPTRKDQALCLQAEYPDVQGLVFALLDGKSIRDMIWKRLRPEHERPFIENADEE